MSAHFSYNRGKRLKVCHRSIQYSYSYLLFLNNINFSARKTSNSLFTCPSQSVSCLKIPQLTPANLTFCQNNHRHEPQLICFITFP